MGSNKIICSTNLSLGLGFSSLSSYNNHNNNSNGRIINDTKSKPSLNLSLSTDYLYFQDSSSASSYQSNGGGKRDRFGSRIIKKNIISELCDDNEEYHHIVVDNYDGDDDYDDCNVIRKKHRLSKFQSSLLEESFKQHTTLNPKQKQHLARELNLKPRQVEVWFQNRRARTKLKQIEAEYKLLKKCCEKLREENTRLHKEVQQLKASLNLINKPSLYVQSPPPPPPSTAAQTTCPSCKTTNKSSLFYNNSLTSPSAA